MVKTSTKISDPLFIMLPEHLVLTADRPGLADTVNASNAIIMNAARILMICYNINFDSKFAKK